MACKGSVSEKSPSLSGIFSSCHSAYDAVSKVDAILASQSLPRWSPKSSRSIHKWTKE
ncbi:hypothetical protein SK128_004679, partial [Halocaridina rubra]